MKKNYWGLLIIFFVTLLLSFMLLTVQFKEQTPPLTVAGQAFYTGALAGAKDLAFFGILKTLTLFFGLTIFFVAERKKK